MRLESAPAGWSVVVLDHRDGPLRDGHRDSNAMARMAPRNDAKLNWGYRGITPQDGGVV